MYEYTWSITTTCIRRSRAIAVRFSLVFRRIVSGATTYCRRFAPHHPFPSYLACTGSQSAVRPIQGSLAAVFLRTLAEQQLGLYDAWL